MKTNERAKLFVAVGLLIVAGILIWFQIFAPIKMIELEREDVLLIKLYNAETGDLTYISNEEVVDHLFEAWSNTTVSRRGLAEENSTFLYDITFLLSEESDVEDIPRFKINSATSFEKYPFVYELKEGSLELGYLLNYSNDVALN